MVWADAGIDAHADLRDGLNRNFFAHGRGTSDTHYDILSTAQSPHWMAPS